MAKNNDLMPIIIEGDVKDITLSNVKYLSSLFLINPLIVIISIIFVYLFNIVIGLIPVFNTLRKRPAQILSRHDLD